MKSRDLLAFVLVIALSGGCATWSEVSEATSDLENEFKKELSGVVLVGYFSVGENKDLHEEKYTIKSVSKLATGLWLFEVRIQYGSHDLTVPLPLNVKWAGDTPVITLTDFSVPGLGRYTARVLIYQDQYAGTWSGKDIGGHLFGRIVREEKLVDS